MANVLYSFYQQLEIEQNDRLYKTKIACKLYLCKFPYKDKPLKYCETNKFFLNIIFYRMYIIMYLCSFSYKEKAERTYV